MKTTSDSKPLYFALVAFLSSIILTIAASLYLNYIINDWIKYASENISTSASSLTESRFNRYKINYYGLSYLFKTIEQKNLDSLSASSSAKNLLNVFGEVNYVAHVQNYGSNKQTVQATFQDYNTINIVSETTNEINSKKFSNYLAKAYSENKPVFYNSSNSSGQESVVAIIPVNKSSQDFYFVDIGYPNLFYPVTKSNLLTNNLHIQLQVFDLNQATNNPLFNTEDLSKTLTGNKKSIRGDVFFKELQLDMLKLKLSFTELKYDTIATVLRQLPFTATVLGIIISVMLFCLVFFTQLARRMNGPS